METSVEELVPFFCLFVCFLKTLLPNKREWVVIDKNNKKSIIILLNSSIVLIFLLCLLSPVNSVIQQTFIRYTYVPGTC